MIQRKTFGERIFDGFNILFMLLLIVVTLYPLIYVLASSLSSAGDLARHRGILLWPVGNINLAAYGRVFSDPLLMVGYRNTLFILVVGVTLNILLTSVGAYVLSRKDVFWNSTFSKLIVVTMLFQGGFIPLFLVVDAIGLMDTRWALILPTAISTFNLIIMRTSFAAIPESLSESAELDGAGHMTILFKIVLPLSKAVIAVMVLFYGVFHWNAWLHAALFIRNESLYPLQLVLRNILILNQMAGDVGQDAHGMHQMEIQMTIQYAMIIIATVPILCLYPFLQKYFAKGVMIGSVKG